MTKSTITREQAEDTIEGLQELISRGIQSVYLDMAIAGMRQLLAAMDQKPALHRYRRKSVEPYGPYPWHYEVFVDYPRPVEGVEDEYFYAAPPVVTGFAVGSEPVAWLLSGGGTKNVVCFDSGNAYSDPLREVTPLYRHAQQQVVPDIDELRLAFEAAERESGDGFNLHKYGIGYADDETQGRWDTWLSCRAAMLQSRSSIQPAPELDFEPNTAEARSGNSPVIPDSSVIGWLRTDYQRDFQVNCTAPQFVMGKNDPSSAWGVQYMPVTKAGGQQNSPQNIPEIIPQWIPVSERMPEKNQNVLISVNFDSSLVEPLICSARYTGSTFRRGEATVKPGSGIEQATHWMPLPDGPQEVNHG